jgi:hypothetical protein
MVVVLLLGYPLSFGPACWSASPNEVGVTIAPTAYWPIGWLAIRSPQSARRVIGRYASLFGKPHALVIPAQFDNGAWFIPEL